MERRAVSLEVGLRHDSGQNSRDEKVNFLERDSSPLSFILLLLLFIAILLNSSSELRP